MAASQIITRTQLHDLVEAIYDQGDVLVRQTYSDFDCPPRAFQNASSLIENLSDATLAGNSRFMYAIYYPEAKGHVFERRIELNPETGHRFRIVQEGWGWITLQGAIRGPSHVECEIAVNSLARARKWFETHPEFGDPGLWDWQVLKRKSSRLSRLLRKLGKAHNPLPP